MSRKDALLRLHKSLVEKRDELRQQLADELSLTQGNSSGDEADAATNGSQSELHSQLAALESRELNQIERAIAQIRIGEYGLCEHCRSRIPMARLKALPFTTTCVNCQQKQEVRAGRLGGSMGNWETVFDYEGAHSDREIRIGDIDLDLS